MVKIPGKQYLFLAFFFFLIFIYGAKAQITLDQNDFGSIGDEVELYTDTSYVGPFSPGPAGAGLTWTFNFPFMEVLDTLFFLDPANTPDGSSFPASNLAIGEGISFSYYNKSSSEVLLNGFNMDLDTFFSNASVNITPALTFLDFPTNYGDSYFSTGTGSVTFPFQDSVSVGGPPIYVDSVRVDFTVTQNDTVNGFGILNLDTLSTNVLRIESWQNIALSIWAKIFTPFGPIWIPVPVPIAPDLDFRTISYYEKYSEYALLTFQLDSIGDIMSNSFQLNPSGISSIIWNQQGDKHIIAYPNPVREKVYFQTESIAVEEIEIFNPDGKSVLRKSLIKPQAGLDVSFLNPGIYFLAITGSKGEKITIRITKI
jgi:Secretion system C-terminal sorting domain